jgi:hypothetical protein
MALNSFFHNKIESMKLEIIERNSKLRRLEAQRNDYNSRGMYGTAGLHGLIREHSSPQAKETLPEGLLSSSHWPCWHGEASFLTALMYVSIP